MSYERLASELQRVAGALSEHERRLEGAKLAAAASRLDTALAKFADLLDELLRAVDPEVEALRQALAGESGRRHLDAKALKLLFKSATGKALTLKAGEAREADERRFVEGALKHGRVAQTLVAVRACLTDAARPAPDPGDREALLAELWRLGRLSAAELELETPRLLGDFELLRAMAGHAYVKVSARSSPKTVLANLVKFARRVNENTA